MTHRVPERLDGLTREYAARCIGDGPGNHHGQSLATRLEHLFNRKDRRLGVQSVKNRLDQDEIHAAIEQTIELLRIGDAQLVKRHITRPRIIHIGRDGGRLGLRAERTRDKAGMLSRTEFVTCRASQAS